MSNIKKVADLSRLLSAYLHCLLVSDEDALLIYLYVLSVIVGISKSETSHLML